MHSSFQDGFGLSQLSVNSPHINQVLIGLIDNRVLFPNRNFFLDGMDGKQARRTKTSSALGELFDHGVDSWASFLFPVCIFSVISSTEHGMSPMAMHLLLLSIYITFIDTHWEKYNTKVLFLPWAYDISMLVRRITTTGKVCMQRFFLCLLVQLMTFTYLLAYFFSPNLFRFHVPILNITFLRVVEYAWPCKFIDRDHSESISFFSSVWTVELGATQYCSYQRVSPPKSFLFPKHRSR